MKGWKEYRLGDYVDIINGFAFKSNNFEVQQSAENLPVIKIKNVANGDVNLNDVQYHKYNKALQRFTADKGDILIALTGNHPEVKTQVVGLTSRYKLPSTSLINQRVAKIVSKDKKKLDNDYLYYFLKDTNTHQTLASNAKGSANQANISKGDIEGLNIFIPPLPTQKAIATILSRLDTKVDLLHCQNQTLEQMAETLFRKWFVEGAKENWKTGTVSDVATHLKKSVNPQKHPDIEFQHYSIPSFDNAKQPLSELGSTIQSSKYILEENAILFSKLNPQKDKRVWLLQDEVLNNSICSTEFQIIKPIDEGYLYFLYGWLTLRENYNKIASGSGGTSGSHQRIDPSTIFSFHCPKIPPNYIEEFNKKSKLLFQKQINNSHQIKNLNQLRDSLLPQLISGAIKLKA